MVLSELAEELCMIASSGQALSLKSRRIRYGALGLGLAPVIGAFFYNQGVEAPFIHCLFQQVFGFPGPACGMTRSFMAFARGDISQALMYHAFGPILFLSCLITAVHIVIELALGRTVSTVYSRIIFQSWAPILGIALFLGYYSLRLYARYSAVDWPIGLENSLAWQLFMTGANSL